jgi:hypothetical protein
MKRALVFALCLQAGCAMSEIRSSGCIRVGAESDHPSDIHLYKAGQPVPGDNLINATADDPEAQQLARLARKHALASLALGAIGVVFTIIGVSVTADGGHGQSNTELAVGVPLAAVGVGALVAAGVEMKKSANRGESSVELYDQHHAACR